MIYDGINDISKYIESRVGKRFLIIKDRLCGYVGLYDTKFFKCPVMSNSTQEKFLNLEIINKAKGNVLIAGLGIGLIVLPIMNKTEVNSIEIIELHNEIIDLVAKQLPLNEKVKIINNNIFTFKPSHKYDTIYFDTVPFEWNTDEEKRTRGILLDQDMPDIYKKYLNPGGFCSYFKYKWKKSEF